MTARKFIHDFYSWYWTEVLKKPTFPTTRADHAELGHWITEHFLDRLEELGEETDADPILCAQDFDLQWLDALTLEPIATRHEGQRYLVTFGPAEHPFHRIKVFLVAHAHSWRVDAVELAPSPSPRL